MKDIPAENELLVWYGSDYGKELGITKNTELTPWQIHRHPGINGITGVRGGRHTHLSSWQDYRYLSYDENHNVSTVIGS